MGVVCKGVSLVWFRQRAMARRGALLGLLCLGHESAGLFSPRLSPAGRSNPSAPARARRAMARRAALSLSGMEASDPATLGAAVAAASAAAAASVQALRRPPGAPPLLDATGGVLVSPLPTLVSPKAPLGFSFSVGGLLFPYQLGVGVALTESGHIVPGVTPLSGSSAGSLVAAVLALNIDLDVVMERLEAILSDCRKGGTVGRLSGILERELLAALPEDCAERLSNGCLTVACALKLLLFSVLLLSFFICLMVVLLFCFDVCAARVLAAHICCAFLSHKLRTLLACSLPECALPAEGWRHSPLPRPLCTRPLRVASAPSACLYTRTATCACCRCRGQCAAPRSPTERISSMCAARRAPSPIPTFAARARVRSPCGCLPHQSGQLHCSQACSAFALSLSPPRPLPLPRKSPPTRTRARAQTRVRSVRRAGPPRLVQLAVFPLARAARHVPRQPVH